MAKLNYWNGTAWVTIAEDNTDYNNFKANGGTLGGPLTIQNITTHKATVGITTIGDNNVPFARLGFENISTGNTSGVGITENGFLPEVTEKLSIGSGDKAFTNIYLKSGYIFSGDGSLQFRGYDKRFLYLGAEDAANSVASTTLTLISQDAKDSWSFRPTATNQNVDLGVTTHRFRNLYLQGDVWTASGTYARTANGYTRLPNGLILQWVTYEETANVNVSTYYKATFPVAFVNLLSTVVTPYGYDSNSNTVLISARATGSTTTYAQVRLKADATTTGFGFRVFAIGI